VREREGDVLEGIVVCTNPDCQREYPVIDGIPILVAAIRAWITANPLQVLQRDDLSPELESLLGDAQGPASAFDVVPHHSSRVVRVRVLRGRGRAPRRRSTCSPGGLAIQRRTSDLVRIPTSLPHSRTGRLPTEFRSISSAACGNGVSGPTVTMVRDITSSTRAAGALAAASSRSLERASATR